MFPNGPATLIRQIVTIIEPGPIAIRRDPRAHSELGFEEIRTSGAVATELTRPGVPHTLVIGKSRIGFGARALSRAAPELPGAEIPA